MGSAAANTMESAGAGGADMKARHWLMGSEVRQSA